MSIRGVMNPTVSIYQIRARGSTPDFDSGDASAPCGVVIDRLLRVWFPLLKWTASLADPLSRRRPLRFVKTPGRVIMGAGTCPEGRRKKEEAEVTFTSVTSAMGLSHDSNGTGLRRGAQKRAKCGFVSHLPDLPPDSLPEGTGNRNGWMYRACKRAGMAISSR